MEEKSLEKTILKSNSTLLGFFVVIFLVGILGGVFGSFAYLDYKGIGLSKGSLAGITSNLTLEENSAVITAVKKVSPAVVSITGTQERLNFFGNVSQAKSSGTGFIVKADGLIVTNKHVVTDSSANYSVFTSDGKEYKATVKAQDPLNDIAILKIDANNLPTVQLGNSDALQVGQRVVAIGNALGQYQNSVTTGVVSAIGRAIQAGDSSGSSEALENVIQTDAAINPGNSGGPLTDSEGNVIGINTAVDQTGQSIGFAIPSNVVKTALDSYLTKGKVIRPMLGVRYIAITKELANSNDLPVSEGAFIYGGNGSAAVVSGSPADSAGLKSGDILTKIGDNKIDGSHSLSSILSKYKVGDKVSVTYIRDKVTKKVDVTLAESK